MTKGRRADETPRDTKNLEGGVDDARARIDIDAVLDIGCEGGRGGAPRVPGAAIEDC